MLTLNRNTWTKNFQVSARYNCKLDNSISRGCNLIMMEGKGDENF